VKFEVRIGFERRLTAVIDELNHRVKNILAVIPVDRHAHFAARFRYRYRPRTSDRSYPCDVNVVSLLSESQWQGVKLKGLFEARAILTPNASP